MRLSGVDCNTFLLLDGRVSLLRELLNVLMIFIWAKKEHLEDESVMGS